MAGATIRCAISPDADDLFMFKGLLDGKVDSRGLTFDIVTRDTDLLNRMASGDGPDVTAISVAHYPAVAARYRLFNHGGSVGRGYGPVVIARADSPPLTPDTTIRIAVPGLTTTAFLVLRLAIGETFSPAVIPIAPPSLTFDALRAGTVDAALVIHEGRLTYEDEGFIRLLDIGKWWGDTTQLPLPLGGNVVRRDLTPDVIQRVDAAIHDSIAWALANREEAIAWLLARGGPLRTHALVDTYLSLYANADTLDYGDDGREAIRHLLRIGADRGWLPPVSIVDFV